MIIFFGLFLIIVAVSFILAYSSMKDFQDLPSLDSGGIYLIQNPAVLTAELIAEIGQRAHGEIISFERLFKGSQSALIILGPKKVLVNFAQLNLLELEDYAFSPGLKISWEMGIKEESLANIDNPFANMPQLQRDEQFWWQLTLQFQDQRGWQSQIRAVLITNNQDRQKQLSSVLQQLAKVVKMPRPLSSDQIYGQYTKRALVTSPIRPFFLTSEQVLKLLGRV